MKGSVAKENVTRIIASALGQDYVGVFDNKIYTWADDGGNRVQVAIALTCPKVYRGVEETGEAELNFEDTGTIENVKSFQPAEITPEEKETLAELMAKFGL